MGMFIRLEIDLERCTAGTGCARCVEVCPVDVFRLLEGKLTADSENEDECTLCDLCLRVCSEGALRLIKLYEE